MSRRNTIYLKFEDKKSAILTQYCEKGLMEKHSISQQNGNTRAILPKMKMLYCKYPVNPHRFIFVKFSRFFIDLKSYST